MLNPFQNAGNPQAHQGLVQRQSIFNILRNKPTPPGWQQTFRLDSRVSCIEQILTHLSLLKPELTAQKVLDVAITFEEREFNTSPDESAYKTACHRKMQEIFQARQSQAGAQMQRGLNPGLNMAQQQQHPMYQNLNQQMQMNMMGQQNIPPQMQQQMQQQLNAARMQNLGHPNMQQPQPQPQPPPPNQLASFQQLHQQLMQGLQELTPQERTLVEQKAREIQLGMSQENKQELMRKAHTLLGPAAKQQMETRGVNIIGLMVQYEALKLFRTFKQKQLLQQAQNPEMNQGMMMGQNQNMFSGNINQQILAQQQEAMRRQQAGQIVVPANQAQQAPNAQGQKQQPANRSWMGQQGAFSQQNQNLWNNGQARQGQAQQPPLQGQIGGLNPNININPDQQTPTMPNLNRPMEPPGQAQSQQNSQPDKAQRRPIPRQFLQNLPIEVKQRLAALPNDDERRDLLMTIIRNRQAQERQAQQRQAQQPSQPPQPAQTAQPQYLHS